MIVSQNNIRNIILTIKIRIFLNPAVSPLNSPPSQKIINNKYNTNMLYIKLEGP
jgi:hypothetical protein